MKEQWVSPGIQYKSQSPFCKTEIFSFSTVFEGDFKILTVLQENMDDRY
ncbi:hypothetical protein B4125_2882 [Bacillus paralicheniformis]|nr:hypothetical protein B4125_2882 [Bacillus paralicheniformis]